MAKDTQNRRIEYYRFILLKIVIYKLIGYYVRIVCLILVDF